MSVSSISGARPAAVHAAKPHPPRPAPAQVTPAPPATPTVLQSSGAVGTRVNTKA